jgi:hypothetical protein
MLINMIMAEKLGHRFLVAMQESYFVTVRKAELLFILLFYYFLTYPFWEETGLLHRGAFAHYRPEIVDISVYE